MKQHASVPPDSLVVDSKVSDDSASHMLSPQSELKEGVGWIVLGIAILIASFRMDRLEAQSINPYTIPGLLPGLLGMVIILLGFLIFLRNWHRLKNASHAPVSLLYDQRAARKKMYLVLALCSTFCLGLLGRGFPFWLTGASFVAVCILSLENPKEGSFEKKFSVKKLIRAVVIGLLAGVSISLVFEQIFMVRLP